MLHVVIDFETDYSGKDQEYFRIELPFGDEDALIYRGVTERMNLRYKVPRQSVADCFEENDEAWVLGFLENGTLIVTAITEGPV